VSGDEAAANPDVRALAERSSKVLAISMFRSPIAGWADLVLPGTSFLERDGTYMNVEGRLQRLRRAVIPPCPDELAWLAKLAERFGVSLSPYPSQVFAELSDLAYGGLDYGGIGEQATLPARPAQAEVPSAAAPAKRAARGKGLRLVTYRPLFSGPAVERVPELQFQRPSPEIELSPDDAKRLKIEPGASVNLRSNGTSVALRARVNRKLVAGVARVAVEHAEGLGTHVEVGA
jgi:NADH-quinone oxidoreductase subunit G